MERKKAFRATLPFFFEISGYLFPSFHMTLQKVTQFSIFLANLPLLLFVFVFYFFSILYKKSVLKFSTPKSPLSVCKHAKLPQTLCNPMEYSLPGSSVHGIVQAKILEWVIMPSSRVCSRPRDGTRVSSVSCIGRQVLYH